MRFDDKYLFFSDKEQVIVNRNIVQKITFGMELLMCIPVIGWLTSTLTGIPIVMLFFMHAASLLLALSANAKKAVNIIGLVAALASFIPIIGWVMHIFVTCLLEISIIKK